jgi:predicted nucleotidyltransferase
MELKENIQQSSGERCQRFGIKKLGLFGSVARVMTPLTVTLTFSPNSTLQLQKRCLTVI